MNNKSRIHVVLFLVSAFSGIALSVTIDFNNYTILSYGINQDADGTVVIEDGGATMYLAGNTWKCIAIDYAITPNTILAFNFQSSVQGEEHAIGLDADLILQADNRFKLYGTQTTSVILDFYNYASFAPDIHQYVIPIGEYYTGSMHYLFFENDHDITSPNGESCYNNIVIYEEDLYPAPYPDPMTWAQTPCAAGNGVTMTATTAADSDGVEYYFSCISGGGHDSGWQDEPTYVDMNLAFMTEYTYTVKARDKSPELNETAFSSAALATTQDFIQIDAFDYELNDLSLIDHWSDGSMNSTGSSISSYLAFYLNVSFDNSRSPYYSEVDCAFAAWDWSIVANDDLSFWYLGDPNATEIYVRLFDDLANSSTIRITDSAITQTASWQNIRLWLADFTGIDLTRITKIVLGIGPESPAGPGMVGTVGFDDIRIISHECDDSLAHLDFDENCTIDLGDILILAEYWLLEEEIVTASVPDNGQLIVHYALNEMSGNTVFDSSGNENDGVIEPGSYDPEANWQTGGIDGSSCIDFNGQFRIDVPQTAFTGIDDAITICYWHYADANDWPQVLTPFIFSTTYSGTEDLVKWTPQVPQTVSAGWNHYAFVKNAAAGIMRIYENGILTAQAENMSGSMDSIDLSACRIGVDADEESNRYMGKVDDFRVYSYALTHSEIIYLAGGSGAEICQPLVPLGIVADPYVDGRIDLHDFSVMASEWLSEL